MRKSTDDKISVSEYTKEVRRVIESNKGGKDAIDRILEAYGFSTKITLCNHLGVSQSTLANRYLRDTLPNDWVIICHLETGARLEWLLAGKGPMFLTESESSNSRMEYYLTENGKLNTPIEISFSPDLLPEHRGEVFAIKDNRSIFVVEKVRSDISDGLWVIKVDGFVSVREIYRLPGGRIKVENGPASYECQASDIEVLGKVISKTEFLRA
ncbi:phage repressor protein CI [Enterobacter sp.]|uniref:phage repressor protein CI n=1 Tax=Enterobacter sp. TaxID=42895 RepID=UPI00296F3BC3|nr:phage repressor protein CI [Enterobacter sp.]